MPRLTEQRRLWPQNLGTFIHSTHCPPYIQFPPPNPLLCRRLLSIRGVNDVLLSKSFLNPVYLPPTHDVHKGKEMEGEQGELRFGCFPTRGRCHEVSIEFRFYRFTCPFVNHRREEVLVKPLAHPLQFPLSTQKGLGNEPHREKEEKE